MSKELEISVSVKKFGQNCCFAAIEYADGEDKKTMVLKTELKHQNRVFMETLQWVVMRDIQDLSKNYNNITLNFDNNKYKKLFNDDIFDNEKDLEEINIKSDVYNRLQEAKLKTNIIINFGHDKVTHLYNEVLSYENMQKIENEKISTITGGITKVFEDGNLNFSKEINNNSVNESALNMYIDVIKSDNNNNQYYVGIATSQKTEDGSKNVMSKIIPTTQVNAEEALREQLKKALFKGETENQTSDLFNTINENKSLNVYCSPENKVLINDELNKIFINNVNLNMNSQHGNNIAKKIKERIEKDEYYSSFEKETLESEYLASEQYHDKMKMAVYISSNSTDEVQSFGAVVRAPGNDQVLYEIEGIVNEDIPSDQNLAEKHGILKTLEYLASKVRNGHLPNNIDFEIRSSKVNLMKEFDDNRLNESEMTIFNNIKKDITSNFSFNWISEENLDPYVSCSQNLAETAKNMKGKNFVLSVGYDNRELLNDLINDQDYSFSKTRKAKKLKM